MTRENLDKYADCISYIDRTINTYSLLMTRFINASDASEDGKTMAINELDEQCDNCYKATREMFHLYAQATQNEKYE